MVLESARRVPVSSRRETLPREFGPNPSRIRPYVDRMLAPAVHFGWAAQHRTTVRQQNTPLLHEPLPIDPHPVPAVTLLGCKKFLWFVLLGANGCGSFLHSEAPNTRNSGCAHAASHARSRPIYVCARALLKGCVGVGTFRPDHVGLKLRHQCIPEKSACMLGEPHMLHSTTRRWQTPLADAAGRTAVARTCRCQQVISSAGCTEHQLFVLCPGYLHVKCSLPLAPSSASAPTCL